MVKSLPLSNYMEQLADPTSLRAIWNTLQIAVGATALAMVLGVALAFLMTRTDMPCKRAIAAAVHLFFLTPGYIGTVAWIQLLGRAGYVTRFLRTTFGLRRPPVNIYSIGGTAVIMGLYLMPVVYMATCNALRRADPSLEKAAISSGATPRQAVATVTLPLVMPSVVSSTLLVFVHGLAGVGAPAALAMPTGNMVLTTQIYAALGHSDVRQACALSVMLTIAMIGAMAVHNRILRRNRYAVTGARDVQSQQLSLGWWRYLVAGLTALMLLCVSFVPVLTILCTSLLKGWGLSFELQNLSLGNYASIFAAGIGAEALRNSLLFSMGGATIAVILAFFVAYIAQRTKLRGRRILDFLATVPSAIPGPVLGAALIFCWMQPPCKLYNTPWIILVAYVAAFLPYAVRNIAGALKAADPRLEEMGWMCGGSWRRVLRDTQVAVGRGQATQIQVEAA